MVLSDSTVQAEVMSCIQKIQFQWHFNFTLSLDPDATKDNILILSRATTEK